MAQVLYFPAKIKFPPFGCIKLWSKLYGYLFCFELKWIKSAVNKILNNVQCPRHLKEKNAEQMTKITTVYCNIINFGCKSQQ